MKKTCIVLLTSFILFYSVIFPIHNKDKVYADTLTGNLAPNGVNSGGAYIISGLLAASGIGAFMSQNGASDVIRQTAINTYNQLDAAKQTVLNQAITSAWNGTNYAVHMTDDVINTLRDSRTLITAAAMSVDGSIESNGHLQSYYSSNMAQVWNYDAAYSLDTSGFSNAREVTAQWFNTSGVYHANVDVETQDGTQHRIFNSDISADTYALLSSTSSDFYVTLAHLGAIGVSVFGHAIDTAVPSQDYFNTALDNALNRLQGLSEIDLPLDQWLAKSPDGSTLHVGNDGTLTLPDGSIYTGDATWNFPVPVINDLTDVTVANPAVPIDGVSVGTNSIPFATTWTEPIPPGGTGGDGTPTDTSTPVGPWSNFMPLTFLLALFDLLRAVIMYLARMFEFIITLPFIKAIPIDNDAFAWFRTAKIMGIQIYDVVVSLATIGFSFLVFRAVRKVLGNA